MKKYNQELREYNSEIAKHNQEIVMKKPGEKIYQRDSKLNENPEYWEKYCPNFQCKKKT